jgi:cation-transporting ATPase E
VLDEATGPRAYVLGAVDTLEQSLEPDGERAARVREWTERGWRVLLFAAVPDGASQSLAAAATVLPARLVPWGLVALSDELQPEARETLAAFAAGGVRLKLISGDDPRTVDALARQVGFPPAAQLRTGTELTALAPESLGVVAEEADILGRVAPEQKAELIRALRRRGHQVAMIGDGVNDVLALKQANLGIALGSGSPAARAVADLVLLDDSFAALPQAVQEGQRVRNGMNDILKLFLTRVLAMTLLLIGTGIVGEFPLGPRHNTLLTLFTVGIPSLALAAWARPGAAPPPSALRQVLHFVIPAALTLSLLELAVHLAAYLSVEAALVLTLGGPAAEAAAIAAAQTAVTAVGIFGGLLLLVFVEPPTKFWEGGDHLSGDARPALLALALVLADAVILVVPGFRATFSLTPLSFPIYLALGAAVIGWAAVLQWLWRGQWFERFFGLEVAD